MRLYSQHSTFTCITKTAGMAQDYTPARMIHNQNDSQRGDVIIFHFLLDPEQDLIKRVIGLPGETIEVQDGIVTVNGAPLDEPYLTEPPSYNGTWVVPEGQYFVLGDNRNDSRDSHQG